MHLEKEYLDNLNGKDLILPSKVYYSTMYVYRFGLVIAVINTENAPEEAMRLDHLLKKTDIDTGTRGLSHDFRGLLSNLKKLGVASDVEFDSKAFKSARDEYYSTIGERVDAFRKDLYEYYGVTDNPKADAVYEKAYASGHSGGFNEVAAHFGDLVDLIVD